MVRDVIAKQVEGIVPYDGLEGEHRRVVLDWIASGADLFRVRRPDVPDQHLVSYFAVIDPVSKKMLLQHHKRAAKWLPAGGHVDPDEDPVETVRRECEEELGVVAEFWGEPRPCFVTVTRVADGNTSHRDVSLWFVLVLDEARELTLEKDKVFGVQWWQIDDILKGAIEQFDPHMHRFCKKLLKSLDA